MVSGNLHHTGSSGANRGALGSGQGGTRSKDRLHGNLQHDLGLRSLTFRVRMGSANSPPWQCACMKFNAANALQGSVTCIQYVQVLHPHTRRPLRSRVRNDELGQRSCSIGALDAIVEHQVPPLAHELAHRCKRQAVGHGLAIAQQLNDRRCNSNMISSRLHRHGYARACVRVWMKTTKRHRSLAAVLQSLQLPPRPHARSGGETPVY